MIHLEVICMLYAICYIQYNLIANTPDRDSGFKKPIYIVLKYIIPSTVCFVLFHMLVTMVNNYV